MLNPNVAVPPTEKPNDPNTRIPDMSEAQSTWRTLLDGAQCPLCAPRAEDTAFWLKIRTLEVSTLYLDRNQTYRGHSQLVYDRRHVVGLESLAAEEFAAFMADVRAAAQAIAAACHPDLMNYASLGNVVPHLHWHLVPRYRGDPRWGGPIYMTTQAEMPVVRLSESEYRMLANTIREQLESAA